MQIGRSSIIYTVVLFVLVGLSVGAAYYRYMVRQDFTYFQTEDEIPDQFDPSAYSQL
ncbi:MAG: hypothetical protein WC798_00345 [Candidatus Paceibacterota bacterium]|jgi:hypothetical protein